MENRREFLKIINRAAITGFVGLKYPQLLSAVQQIDTIRSAAKNVGIHYGAHSEEDFVKTSASYQNLFLKQCELYAPNFSWSASFPQETSTGSTWEDPNISFALQHALRLTGGHIVWHLACPKWFANTNNPNKAIANYANYLISKYGNHLYSWNPVNEGINVEDGRPDGLRNSPFMKKIGPGYFKVAFDAAKAASPTLPRVYNDYGMEMDNKYQADRRKALLNLLDKFKADGTPVDAIGLQSHLRLDGSKFNEQLYSNFLKEISSRGYKIYITELDVFDKSTKAADFATRDQQVADLYKQFLSVALNEPAVKTLITWGISDRYTWLTAKYKYVRPDGQPNRPLLFDENMKPKPAFNAILNALKHAPRRTSQR